MARRISDEQIKLTIIINGNEAQKEILDLEKANFKLRTELKEQEAQLKKLERQKKTDTDEYRKLSLAIKANTSTLNENDAKIKQLTADLSLADKTMGQLRTEATMLQATLRHLVPGTADFDRYNADLAKINARMGELKGNGQQASWSIGSLADKFNRYAALGASVLAAGTGVVLSVQKILDINGKLSDSYVNVQKTTGMTSKEVDELAKSFGMLKTRTSRADLLNIAAVGGELGVAKEEIASFVKVMNKSAVALGDAFEGGPEVVADKLGKIKGLYEELRNSGIEPAFESVGSALNELGADGTASAQNVAEFTQAVGTIPGKLKPSIQQALGLGAAFEESGLMAEIAGNNYGKLIGIASRDYAAFAKVMGRPAEELKQLINTDPTEFFLQFAQSLKGLDATELSKVLDYLKLNDQEVKQVLGAASDNVQKFRDKISLASTAMAEATSLTEEYDLKNNNLAATLERLKKTVVGWFTSDSVVAFITSAVDKFAKFVGAIEDTGGGMTALRNTLVFLAKAIAVVSTALVTNAAWMKIITLTTTEAWQASKLYTLGLKAKVLMENIGMVASQAYAAVTMLLTGNIKGATQAIRVMANTMKTTPWGLVIGIITAAVSAYIMFSDEVKRATEEQKAFLKIQTNVNSSLKDEKQKINDLISIAKNEKLARDTRLKAVKDLIAISPEYLKGLSLETINTKATTAAINEYIKALDRKLQAEQIENEIKASMARISEIELKDVSEYKNWTDELTTFFDTDGEKTQNTIAANRRINALKAEEDLQKKLYEKRKKLYIDSGGLTAIDPKGNAKAPGDTEKGSERAEEKARKLREKSRKEAQDEAKKAIDDNLELERKGIDDRLALMVEGFDKEEALENENHKRKLADLKKQLIDQSELDEVDAKIEDPNADKRTKAHWMHVKEAWREKNAQINNLIEIEEGRHTLALETIYTKAENKRIQDIQADFDRAATLRQAAHNTELAQLGKSRQEIEDEFNKQFFADGVSEAEQKRLRQQLAIDLAALSHREKAKQDLQDKFDQEEYDKLIIHLKNLLAAKEEIFADRNSKIEFELLTDAEKKAVEDDIAQLKLKISEAVKAKQDLQGKNGSDDPLAAMENVFGGADVLGFTADQWGQTFDSLDTLERKMAAAVMVVGALQNAWATFGEYQNASEDAALAKYEQNQDARKRKLKWQLDNGYINQMQYKRGIETLDAELEKKKAEAAYKQAKRNKAMSMANVVINTAQAIMGIWAQFPKFDFGATAAIMSGVVGALGAVQLATIAKTPLPAKGYEKGLYPDYVKREQDGKMFRANYGGRTRSGMVNKPTYFLAGENGPEMVIDNAAYRQMSPETKDMLIRELRGIKGFEKGKYNNDVTGGARIEVPAASGNISSADALAIIAANTAALNRFADIMEKTNDEGIIAYMSRDGRELKKFQDELDRIKNSRDKAQN